MGLILTLLVPLAVGLSAVCYFALAGACKGRPDSQAALVVGLLCLCLATGATFLTGYTVRKIRAPDVLELSPDVFRFVSIVDHKDISACWAEVGAPEKRIGNKAYYLHVDIAGEPQSFPDRYWGLSMKTMMGIINSGREGHFVSPEAWLAEHPEPDETKSQLLGVSVGLAGVVVLVLLMHFTGVLP